MMKEKLRQALRFYFITDDTAPDLGLTEQVRIALEAGATMVQYRNKAFSPRAFEEVSGIRALCRLNGVPFIVNDNIILAKAVSADGVHLGQTDADPAAARSMLGPEAIIGVSISTPDEYEKTDLTHCNYIGTGPVSATTTKDDAKSVIGMSGLESVASKASLPVVAIGGMTAETATEALEQGAAGAAVISYITRAHQPAENAMRFAQSCGCESRSPLRSPWNDEFGLIEKLLTHAPVLQGTEDMIKVGPGDDAALLGSLTRPVITTDTQRENVHFRLEWATLEEVGRKAVEVTLSDLAASFAAPVSIFINLSLPADFSDDSVEELYRGINQGLTQHGCTLGGGNISAASQFSIDLFAIGQGHKDIFPQRSAAKPGDGIYCSGPIGLARAGLEALFRDDHSFETLISAYKRPSARFDAARILAKNGVICATDISDGLAGDAGHIAVASNLTVAFDLTSLVSDPSLTAFCEKYSRSVGDIILSGGDDYELLFTCPPASFEAIQRDLPGAVHVGGCEPYSGTHLANLPPDVSSFQHGKTSG
ncbi:MAG: thiamine-phosphate kinase [Desulfobacterales bacterium]